MEDPKEAPYDVSLCVEMMSYCALSNPKTADMTASEFKKAMEAFFPTDVIEQAELILTGKSALVVKVR